jgi:CHAD domain-containing protein
MDPDPTLLELPAPAAARRVALGFLEQAEQAAARLGDAEDAEALHDFRVALRRLRSSLRQYRPYLRDSVRGKDQRRLRELMAPTSPGRDLEVGIEWLQAEQTTGETTDVPDGGRLEERLRSRLTSYRVRLDESPSRYLRGFAEATGQLVRHLSAALAARLAEVRTLADQEQAHRARLVGKQLRYLLEPLRGVHGHRPGAGGSRASGAGGCCRVSRVAGAARRSRSDPRRGLP